MAYEKQYQIANMIIAQTKAGFLSWEVTYDEDSYQANLKDFSVKITEERDFNSMDNTYVITVLDKLGNVIERFNDEELAEDKEKFTPLVDNYYTKLKDIFHLIKRKARGVDQALDGFIKELSEGNDIPF